MSDLQRFVPNGCEFYQYREAMSDIRSPDGQRLESVLLKSMTVRRKSDGFFFAMSWYDDASARRAAESLAEDVIVTRLGGNRVDLGEANLGQHIRVAGEPLQDGRICLIDDAAKIYKLTCGRVVPWSQARDA